MSAQLRFFAPPIFFLAGALVAAARFELGRLPTHLLSLGAAFVGAVWMSELTRLEANSGFVGEGAFVTGATLALVAMWWAAGAIVSSFLFAVCGQEARHVIWIQVVAWPSPVLTSWMIDWWLSAR
ncbi:MAG: hypothetical protein JNM69_34935 [Archangium sp.]|nr:hypothetical protein [Archangium sp.]